eukprot:TRINITY_DN730_c0_g1_i1.p1 TRINITY_DN730_c0_g1~~TRINITY_DN730_c0_g1_i1.p1  ORF type:complete len:235 (+),score=48.41 TRINITY_DN730_c0_g1_i1:46-705(+)
MSVSKVLALLLVGCHVAFASTGGGLMFPMELDEQRCFYEKVGHSSSKVFSHVQVLDGGYDLQYTISGPILDGGPGTGKENLIYDGDLVSVRGSKKVLFKAMNTGDVYKFCVKNGNIMMKSVSINVNSHDPTDQGVGPYKPMEPIKKTIIRLSEALHSIKEEQHYLRTRERIHRDTASNTFNRLMFWSILACTMLIAMGVGQLWYYNRLFGNTSSRSRGV